MAKAEVTRRAMLGAGVAIGASGAAGASHLLSRRASVASPAQLSARHVDETFDVIVVGSGAAAMSAASTAVALGNQVVMLEALGVLGGTTLVSGGIYWIPGNHLMSEAGLTDDLELARRYMAQISYPHKYLKNVARYGLTDHEYAMIHVFSEKAAPAIKYLNEIGALSSGLAPPFQPDYYAAVADTPPQFGRPMALMLNGKFAAGGPNLIQGFRDYLNKKGASLRTEHEVVELVSPQILAVKTPAGTRLFGARKAIFFGTGGFIRSEELCKQFLPGPVFGSCGSSRNRGDLIRLTAPLGVSLGNMHAAWWRMMAIEASNSSDPTHLPCVMPSGDSMLIVNKRGVRVASETAVYDSLARTHFAWSAGRGEASNTVLFQIFDKRVRDKLRAAKAPWVMEAPTLDALETMLRGKLTAMRNRIGTVELVPDFVPQLKASIARFNGFARTGKDLDFGRGEAEIERWWFEQAWNTAPTERVTLAGDGKPNRTMYPISEHGPYYAVILGAGAMDTKGGPRTDTEGRLLDWEDKPIPRLYGAGNCVASPAAEGYWGSGGTIGPAMVFGHLAAVAAHGETAAIPEFTPLTRRV